MENSTSIPENTVMEFSWVEYTLFTLMLGCSILINLYYGCFGTKQASTNEYLLGGRNMRIFPAAMSLIASSISGLTLLGLPAEIYMYGTQYWMCVLSILILALVMIYIYIPIFHNLQLKNLYEYIELRYDRRMKIFITTVLALNVILILPIVIYVPALALNQVNGMNIHVTTSLICVFCIFYTALGGLKGIVWSDTVQLLIMIVAMTVIFFLGLDAAGGLTSVFSKAAETERLEFFNWDMDPTSRTTFWSIIIGFTTLSFTFHGINPFVVQRFLAVPTLTSARRTAVIFYVGLAATKSLGIITGLIMHAKYHDCDPFTSRKVKKFDQILPFFVMDISRSLTGLAGIFVAGITTAALSTMSTMLNTLAGQIFEDFVQPSLKKKTLAEETKSNIIKLIVVVIGLISFGMVFVVENLSGVMELQMALNGFATGPTLAIFTMGIYVPFANSDGAFYSYIISGCLVAWIGIGKQVNTANGYSKPIFKPLRVDGCQNFTQMFNITSSLNEEEPFYLFRLSFYWYSVIGFIVTMILGMAISYSTRHRNVKKTDRNLFSPWVHSLLLEKTGKDLEYFPVKCDELNKS